jgi:hypothetical protein
MRLQSETARQYIADGGEREDECVAAGWLWTIFGWLGAEAGSGGQRLPGRGFFRWKKPTVNYGTIAFGGGQEYVTVRLENEIGRQDLERSDPTGGVH